MLAAQTNLKIKLLLALNVFQQCVAVSCKSGTFPRNKQMSRCCFTHMQPQNYEIQITLPISFPLLFIHM